MKKPPPIPLTGRLALRKLGSDLCDARRRRRIPMALMAERTFLSCSTLGRIEKGDASVAMGSYVTVLFVLGMTNSLRELADLQNDPVGRTLDEERLPKRIRTPKPFDNK